MAYKRFGDAAIGLGYATPQQVNEALAHQQKRLEHDGDQVMIGFLMVEAGALTAQQLLEILNETSTSGRLISEDAILLSIRLEAMLGNDDKVIMICGAKEEEGGSNIATQLAIAMSLMNKGQVLLMDANLRKPSQHKRLQRKLQPGLSDFVVDDAPFKDIIQSTDLEHLSLLSAGGEATDALPVLLSENYAQLTTQLRGDFHRIIVDAPPIQDCPDATVIASHTDGIILIVSENKRSRDEVRDIMRVFDGMSVPVIGSVLSNS